MKHASKYEGKKGFHIVTNLRIYDVPEEQFRIERKFDYHFRNKYYFGDIELFKCDTQYSKDNPEKYDEKYLDKLIMRITSNGDYYEDALLDMDDDDALYYGSSDNSRLNYTGEHKEIIRNKIFELNGIYMPRRK